MEPDFDSAKEFIERNKSHLRASFIKAQKEYERKMFFPSFLKDKESLFDKAKNMLEREVWNENS